MSQATPTPDGLRYDAPAGGEQRARVSVAHYTADEVIQQFLALYQCLDFKTELAGIGIGRFQFSRRRKALREFKVLAVALWGLALHKSFPSDAEDFFNEFKAGITGLTGTGKAAELFVNKLDMYTTLLALKKDSDFLPVAEYISEALSLNADDFYRLRLKLSLVIRNLYMLIFGRLV